jgi:hypothetical protein
VFYWTRVQLASGLDELDTPLWNPRQRVGFVETSQGGQAMAVLTRFHIVTLAFALLLSISGTTFAAQGSRHSRIAVVKHHSVTTSRADVSRIRAFAPGGTSGYPYGPGINFPYPERPYGDPDRY